MSKLSRKQIVFCKKCHKDIHYGKYDSKSYKVKQSKGIHVNIKIFNDTKRRYVIKPFKYWYGYLNGSSKNKKTFKCKESIVNHKGWFREDVKVKYIDDTIKKGKEFLSRSHVKTKVLPTELQNKNISVPNKLNYTSGVNVNRLFVSDGKDVDFKISKSNSWDRNHAKAHIYKVIQTKPLMDSETDRKSVV